MNENWYALHVRAQRERRSSDRLAERGFETYVPWVRQSARRTFPLALFPGYFFARLEVPTISIVDRGWDIFGVVGTVPVPDEAILELRSRERGGRVLLPEPFKKGDLLQITEGTYWSQMGLYRGMTADDRVIVLLTMLGRECAIHLSRREVRLAEPITFPAVV